MDEHEVVNVDEVESRKKRKIARKWSDEEVEELIDLYEGKSILWNLFDNRDLRELATKEISEKLGIALGDIKAKFNSLRALLGRELMKVRKTKSGQATNELYVSNWAHWDRLQFLAGVIQAAKT